MQRFRDYFKGSCSTRHGKTIAKSPELMNHCCLAHHGLYPELFLPILAEGVLMIYIGTVGDPGHRSNSMDRFIYDDLYTEFKKLRLECQLDEPVAKGLNSTWTFTQGWRCAGLVSGSACINCGRVMPPKDDPLYRRLDWRFADRLRPSGSHVKCKGCVRYLNRTGDERPLELEKKLVPSTYMPKGTKPAICQWKGCDRDVKQRCGKMSMYLCSAHHSRAERGKFMDAELKPPRTYKHRNA